MLGYDLHQPPSIAFCRLRTLSSASHPSFVEVQDRLDLDQRAQKGGRAADTPPFVQVLQRVYTNMTFVLGTSFSARRATSSALCPSAAARAAARAIMPSPIAAERESPHAPARHGASPWPPGPKPRCPLSSDEMWIETMASAWLASERYTSRNSPTEGCEVVGKLRALESMG